MSNKNKILKGLLASAVVAGSAGSAMATPFTVTVNAAGLSWSSAGDAGININDGPNNAAASTNYLKTGAGAFAPASLQDFQASFAPTNQYNLGAGDINLTAADTISLATSEDFTFDGAAATLETMTFNAANKTVTMSQNVTINNGVAVANGAAIADSKMKFGADTVLTLDATGAGKDINATITTGATGQGTLKATGNNTVTLKGSVGATDAALKKVELNTANITAEGDVFAPVEFSGDKILTMNGADAKNIVGAITTNANNQGTLIFNFNSTLANQVGADGNALNSVRVVAAKTLTTTADIYSQEVRFSDADATLALGSAGAGKKVTGTLAANAPDSGVLNVYNGSAVTGNVATVAGSAIKKLSFVEDGTFTVGDANGGNQFNSKGVDFASKNATLAFANATATTMKVGADNVANAQNATITSAVGANVDFTIDVGANNLGADANPVKEINTNAGNLVLSAVGPGNTFVNTVKAKELKLGAGNHKITTLDDAGNAKLVVHANGAKIVKHAAASTAMGGAVGTLKFPANNTLTLDDTISLTANAVDTLGAVQGKIQILGDSTLDLNMAANTKIDSVDFAAIAGAKTLTIAKELGVANGIDLSTANAANLNLSAKLDGAISSTGGANLLTLNFKNEKGTDVKVTGTVSTAGAANALKVVNFDGGNVLFEDASHFRVTEANFTDKADKDTTVTLQKFNGANTVNTAVKTATDGTGIVKLDNDLVVGAGANFMTIGEDGKKLQAIELTADKTITVVDTKIAYVDNIITNTNEKGIVTFAGKHDSIWNIGSAEKAMKSVDIAGDSTVKGAIYAKDIAFGRIANKTLTIEKDGSLNGKTAVLNVGTILVKDGGAIASDVYSMGNNAFVTFEKSGSVTGKLGFDAASALEAVNFIGDKDAVVTISKDITAADVNHVNGGTVKLASDVKLDGAYNLTASTLDLQTHTATVTGATTLGNGESVIKSKLAGQAGSVTGGKLVVNTATAVANTKPTVQVMIDMGDVLPNSSDSLQLISATDANDANTIASIKGFKDSDITVTGNKFGKASMDDKGKITFGRDLSSIVNLVKGADVSVREGVSALANSADSATGDAAKIISNFGAMTDSEQKEASERLFERASTAAATQVTSAVSTAVSGRMSSSVNTNFAATLGAAEGVAAGDNMSSNMGAWASFVGQKGKQSKRKGDAGYTLDMQGGIVGFDTAVNDSTVVGAAVAMSNTTLKHKDDKSGDKVKAKTSMFSVYGSKEFGSNWVGQAMAMFGSTDVTTNEGRKLRTGAANVKATGKYTTMTYALEALGGYRYVLSDVSSVTDRKSVV